MDDGEAPVPVGERLLKERLTLLDLSTRNRLLNTPLRVRNNRSIEIVDEKAVEVFRLLSEGRALSFLPGVELTDEERAGLEPDDRETGAIPQPDGEAALDDRGVPVRYADTRLQTRLTSEGLQKRLFDIWYDAGVLEEEQGVNILYLAVGLLRWFEADNSEVARHAPLVLLPVQLERTSAADRFKLKGRHEPPSPNLTLQEKLKREFGVTLEDFQDEDALDLPAYFAKAAETVASQPRWEVLPDAMVLGFFSFAKFLMYRDLDAGNWPAEAGIDQHPLIAALLRDGFPESEPLVADDTAKIDRVIPPAALNHVLDADSSQAVVIAEAAGGRTLVVKGPPGTGKSQTITNVIAAAVAQGRKVLFVAEKMAALDVVERRLRQADLGPLLLELHSNKAGKRAILDELRRTKDAPAPSAARDGSVIERLGLRQGGLNAFAERLHTSLRPCGLSPREIVGHLVRTPPEAAANAHPLDGADRWTPRDAADRRRLIADIAERLAALGPPPQHPWCGVRRGAIDPVELRALVGRIGQARLELAKALQAAADANTLVGDAPVTLAELGAAAAALAAARALPASVDRRALSKPGWASDVDGLARVVAAGQARQAALAAVSEPANPVVWDADLAAIRIAVVTKGRSWFRFLDGDYKRQIALLRSYLREPLTPALPARVDLLDRLIGAQRAMRAFDHIRPLGPAFGAAWRAEESDWAGLSTWVVWARANPLPAEVLARLAKLEDMRPVLAAADAMAAAFPAFRQALEAAITELDLDLKRSLGVAVLPAVAIEPLQRRLARWLADPESLTRFIAFAERGREATAGGMGALVEAVLDGAFGPAELLPAFDAAYAETLRAVLFVTWPELKGFDGDTLNQLVAEFRDLDRARIELAKTDIAAAHAAARPRGAAGVGPLGVLNAELAKRRRLLPIRQLLERAGPAIQQLKPVFMMSPLSVAQYLKPGGLTFDLMVMDEASQIEPVDALGAVARARQIVVVGDERQLPPTAFFRKLTGDDADEADDDGVPLQAKDAESILDLALAKGAPHRMLSWHYRSKHQSLIAVSNSQFYENRLFIVPSPYAELSGMGLKFHLLTDAPYDRGGTRTNPTEAKHVAEAVMRHARETPHESLGVATFSVAQRQAVLKELELARRASPETEAFFARTAAEPFFVKNLENIQGDERDVIFISVGYGKTAEGYLAHNFGPLSGEGGERRLNVLISRAKLRCEVFCNFTGADLDLERTKAQGVAALKLFLTFAETGDLGQGEAGGLDHDSEFEAEVAARLQARGHGVRAQIGASGFRVDLAVVDPAKPGRFVLGIECDGAQYHASRSARDRDRLRQQVLEAHGWIIHRIWSTDWYLRPGEELKKLESAIAAAQAQWHERDAAAVAIPDPPPERKLPPDPPPELPPAASVEPPPPAPTRPPYVEARFDVDRRSEPHEVWAGAMADYVAKVVAVEGPVHIDEIVTRIRELWGLARSGGRIRAAVERAAALAAGRGLIVGGPFYSLPGEPVVVRGRAEVASKSLRRPEALPPAEIDAAALDIVAANYGAGRDELILAVARDFGFAATSAQLRAVIDARIDALVASGALAAKDGILVRP